MKLGIMQPYFFPYIGYWQLINFVDEFIIYDNIQYTKKGWINRNRVLCNGKDNYITLPLKKDSDYLDVKDRYLSDIWKDERVKLLNKINQYYRKAPFFDMGYDLLVKCCSFDEKNLFKFIYYSILIIKDYLEIETPLIISSTIPYDRELNSEDMVIELCKFRKTEDYVNPIGGVGLYNKDNFMKEKINLNFIKSNEINYKQFNDPFVPWLSILDIIMFNSKEDIKNMLNDFTLI